jgi:hypothetical protein
MISIFFSFKLYFVLIASKILLLFNLQELVLITTKKCLILKQDFLKRKFTKLMKFIELTRTLSIQHNTMLFTAIIVAK